MSKKSKNIRLLCFSAMMAAVFAVLDFFSDAVSVPFGDNLRISFNGLPVLLASVFGGPLWGALTGFAGAFIGQLRWGLSAMTVLWVLPEVVRGLIMGWVFAALGKSCHPAKLGVGALISSLAVTLCNTAALTVNWFVCGGKGGIKAIMLALPFRVLAGLITAVLMTAVLPIIVRPLKKIIK